MVIEYLFLILQIQLQINFYNNFRFRLVFVSVRNVEINFIKKNFRFASDDGWSRSRAGGRDDAHELQSDASQGTPQRVSTSRWTYGPSGGRGCTHPPMKSSKRVDTLYLLLKSTFLSKILIVYKIIFWGPWDLFITEGIVWPLLNFSGEKKCDPPHFYWNNQW